MDDPFLGMQARNLALVDAYLTDMEREVLHRHVELERTPVPEIITLSAFSQLWVFGFYELLRTWRQRCRDLVAFRRRYDATPDSELQSTLADEVDSGLSPSGIQGLAQEDLRHRLEAATIGPLADQMEAALARTREPFRRLESLRVTLAKHEIPKARGIPTTAPGYARQNMLDGSLTWFVELKDGTQDLVTRSQVVDDFIATSLSAQ
ncbi:MAG: hypothetical protein AB7N73_06815 [Gemmatimonadales bacterium]